MVSVEPPNWETRRTRVRDALAPEAARTWTRGSGANQLSFTVSNAGIRDLPGLRVLSLDVGVASRNGVKLYDDRINMPNPAVGVRDAGGTVTDNPLQALRDTLFDVVNSVTQGGSQARLHRNPDGSFQGDTTAVRSSTADGMITSTAGTYANARNGTALVVDTAGTNDQRAGVQVPSADYTIWLLYLDFLTSAIPDADEVTDAVLTLYGEGSAEIGTGNVQARVSDWSAGGLTTADWIDLNPATNWTALTEFANFDIASWNQTSGAANNFTNAGAGALAAVSKTGTTYLVVGIDAFESDATPGSSTNIQTYLADNAGTASDPLLTVTHFTPRPPQIWTPRQAIHRSVTR